jgi:plasmid stabilization system protein ParE
MPRGDKSAYTDKQKRQAEHIEEGYKEKGLSAGTAEKRAWATVNKASGGGKKSGSGRGKAENKEPYVKGGRKGGRAGGKAKAGGRATAARPKAKTIRSKSGKAAAHRGAKSASAR